jgi:hypothetical protein
MLFQGARLMARKWRWLLVPALLATLVIVYVCTHPLVFMETHSHCITQASLALREYAASHDGKFPYHPKGYGNALLLLPEDCYHSLTGPGYDAAALREAKHTGRDLTEAECGRVYIQGLTSKSDGRIALLFDQRPTPGGDHCELPARLWAPLGREVLSVEGGGPRFVSESEWPEFAREQVQLLVKEGFSRKEAERLFSPDHR